MAGRPRLAPTDSGRREHRDVELRIPGRVAGGRSHSRSAGHGVVGGVRGPLSATLHERRRLGHRGQQITRPDTLPRSRSEAQRTGGNGPKSAALSTELRAREAAIVPRRVDLIHRRWWSPFHARLPEPVTTMPSSLPSTTSDWMIPVIARSSVRLQRARECRSSGMQPPLRRAFGNAEFPREIRHGIPMQVMHHQEMALVNAQPIE